MAKEMQSYSHFSKLGYEDYTQWQHIQHCIQTLHEKFNRRCPTHSTVSHEKRINHLLRFSSAFGTKFIPIFDMVVPYKKSPA
jgi:hypothetical protein